MLPSAIYTIEFKTFQIGPKLKAEFEDSDQKLVSGERVYLIGDLIFDNVTLQRMGRSRPIADFTTAFDFTADRMTWKADIPVSDSKPVLLALYVMVDTIDSKREAAACVTANLRLTTTPGDQTATDGDSVLTFSFTVLKARPAPTTGAHTTVTNSDTTTVSSTLDQPPEIRIEFLDIKGLYQSTPTDDSVAIADGTAAPALSKAVTGYASHDNLGRIFVNRLPDGKWKAGEQYIEISVRLHMAGLGGPSNKTRRSQVKVKWSAFVPDDPTNDNPLVHQTAGKLFDPPDYDSNGVHLGAAGYDNEGANDAWTKGAKSIFAEVGGYKMTVGSAEAAIGIPSTITVNTENEIYLKPAVTETKPEDPVQGSQILTRESKIRIHCPDLRGDRLVIRADLDRKDITGVDTFRVLPAQTGIMTMWERIDVEYRRMETGNPLPIGYVPRYFEPVFVQFDFQVKDNITDKALIPNKDFATFFDSDDVFAKRKTAGWFSLVSALEIGGKGVAADVLHDKIPGILGHHGAETLKYLPDTTRQEAAKKAIDDRGKLAYAYLDVRHTTAFATDKKLNAFLSVGDPPVLMKMQVGAVEEINLEPLGTPEGMKQRLRMLGYTVGAIDTSTLKDGGTNEAAYNKFRTDYPKFGEYLGTLTSPSETEQLKQFGRFLHWLYVTTAATKDTAVSNTDLAGAESTAAKAWRLVIGGHDIIHDFKAGNGNVSDVSYPRRLFFPQHRLTLTNKTATPTVDDEGYLKGKPLTPAVVTLKAAAASPSWAGYSPEWTLEKKNDHFGGLAIIGSKTAMLTPKDTSPGETARIRRALILTIVHEFTHAFGFPHKCGRFDSYVPKEKTCCMNYPNHPMVNDAGQLILGTDGKSDITWCGLHLKELRRVRLKNNRVLKEKRNWT